MEREGDMTSAVKELKLRIPGSEELARRIDHAVLSPSASMNELEAAIKELEEYNLRCLIVSPTLLPYARSSTKRCIGAVAGFPHGYHPIQAKLKEVEEVAATGADEVDYVMNTQNFLLGKTDTYIAEAKAVSELCRDLGVRCKLIIETPLLADVSAIYRATALIAEAVDADYVTHVKTSTGYAPRPTYPEDVLAIKKAINDKNARLLIKAAGGIRTAMQAVLLLNLGADIIGTSKPAKILNSLKELQQLINY
jgi:deoxyribose-phosphate aldolase